MARQERLAIVDFFLQVCILRGVDIIRTWAYYLMVRHLALFGEKPYRSCLINGMCRHGWSGNAQIIGELCGFVGSS